MSPGLGFAAKGTDGELGFPSALQHSCVYMWLFIPIAMGLGCQQLIGGKVQDLPEVP